MSLDLAELLTAPSSGSSGLLDQVRASWPLNGKADSLDCPADTSDRVRLRRVLDTLDGWGISASGIEPSHELHTAQVYFRGSFSTSGSLKERLLGVKVEDREVMEQLQVALQAVGWPAVVSRHDALLVPRDPVDSNQVKWLELGFTAPVGSMSPERAATWVELCPNLDSPHSLEGAEASGISPEEMAPWAALEDENGDAYIKSYPHRVSKWIAAGISPEDALPWFAADHHLLDRSLVEEWIAAGCGPLESEAWINLLAWGADPRKMKDWTDKGFTDKHAVRILRAGGSAWNVHSMIDHAGATPAEAVAWIECGVTNYSSVDRWLEIGVGGHDLRRWNRAAQKGGFDGFLKREQVSAWLEAGRSFSEAEPWLELNASFVDLELVASWEEEGLAPDNASQWARNGVPSLHQVKAWQATHPACSDPSLVGQLVKAGVEPAQAALVLEKLRP